MENNYQTLALLLACLCLSAPGAESAGDGQDLQHQHECADLISRMFSGRTIPDIYVEDHQDFFNRLLRIKEFEDNVDNYISAFPMTLEGMVDLARFTRSDFFERNKDRLSPMAPAALNYATLRLYHFWDNNPKIDLWKAQELRIELDKTGNLLFERLNDPALPDGERIKYLLSIHAFMRWWICTYGVEKGFTQFYRQTSKIIADYRDSKDPLVNDVVREIAFSFFFITH